MGVVPAKLGYLAELAAGARQNGALLVADEVITGFRVARGGGQELLGSIPTSRSWARSSAVACPRPPTAAAASYMQRIAPAGDVYQAGTLSGNPLAVAAGLATLAQLDDGRLRAAGRAHGAARRRPARSSGERGPPDCVVQSVTGLVTPFFTDAEAVRTMRGAAASDQEAYGAFCRGLIARGVYPPPSQFEAWFPSLAHSERDIELTVEAAAEVLRRCE